MTTPNKTGQSYMYTNFYPKIGLICRNWSSVQIGPTLRKLVLCDTNGHTANFIGP